MRGEGVQRVILFNENATPQQCIDHLILLLNEETQRRVGAEAERDEAIRQRDELRAILAPLLETPVDEVLIDGVWRLRCRFCWAVGGDPVHGPDCPALPDNRGRLLGRAPTDDGGSA